MRLFFNVAAALGLGLASAANAVLVTVKIPDPGTVVDRTGDDLSVSFDGVQFLAPGTGVYLANFGSDYTGEGGNILESGSAFGLVVTLPVPTRFVSFKWGSYFGVENGATNEIVLSNGAYFQLSAPGTGLFGLSKVGTPYSFSTNQPTSFISFTIYNHYSSQNTNQIANLIYRRNLAYSVPEPASWVMLIAGFGLIGTALRRCRSVTVVA